MIKDLTKLTEEIERLEGENKKLQQQLHEAHDSIEKIKKGHIDALVVAEENALRIYTEKSADRPFRILIEKMHEGAVTVNEAGLILYCNAHFAGMVNLPLQEVIGKTFTDFIDDATDVCFDEFFKQGQECHSQSEVNLLRDSGGTTPVLMTLNIYSIDDITALSIIITDLTIPKQDQEELKKSATKLKEKHDELEDAYDELVHQCREKAKWAAELVSINKKLAFENEDKAKRAAELVIANKELAFQNREKARRAKELINAGKELARAQKKITKLNKGLETKVAERTKELEISQQHFKFLTDNIPQIAFTANADGKIDYCNARWYEYTGISLATAHKYGWHSVVHPVDQAKSEMQWKTSIKTGKAYVVELRMRCDLDKSYRWQLCRALPFKDEKGKIVKWFGTFTDIEEQKRSIEEKDEFIGIASHELRTPITSLTAYLQLLERELKETSEATAKSYVSKSRGIVEKINLLVTELHDVTKIQAGKFQLKKTKFNFEEFLKKTIESIQISNSSHEIIKVGETPVPIHADQQRLQQVLFNYLSNAIKYSPGSNKVIVEAFVKRNELTVAVKDFGLGIPKKEQEKLFSRFFRASTTQDIEGLGLGLYLYRQIISAHNGKVWMESEQGKGSAFYFSIPIKK